MKITLHALILSVTLLLAGTSAMATPVQTESPDATQQLVDRFMRLYRSIQASGGFDDTHRPFVSAMLDEVEAARQQSPRSKRLAAVAVQLAILLEDDDRVFDLFAQLQALDPNNEQIAQDWLSYFRQSDAPERADDVIEQLVDMNLEGPALRRTLAGHLKQSMQYQRAIDYLSGLDLDPSNNPDAMLMLAECLFAEHQFERANEIITSIPESAVALNPTTKNRIAQNKEYYAEYAELWPKEQEIRSAEAAADDLPRAELITEDGRIVVELFENEAPNTVANFITLAEQEFYDGTQFHRVMTNFMAQGGDPLSREGAEGTPGTGGPGYYIPDEHTRDDHRMHFAGSLSMAKTSLPNTAGSGFYLTFEPTPWLNGRHTVFGRVLEGMDIVRQIRQDDELLEVNILRKRDHDYTVKKLPLPGQSLPDDGTSEAETGDTDAEDAATGEAGAEDATGGETGEEAADADTTESPDSNG